MAQVSTLTPQLHAKIQGTRELLVQTVTDHGAGEGSIVYASSLGAEAMVLTDLIWTHTPQVEIISIDTGRLHEETYSLLDRVQRRYGRRIKVYYPDAAKLEQYVGAHGINGFYNSLEERQSCCHIRKVEPFQRAIAGRKAWITGVRREQSPSRAMVEPVEWDERNQLHKISPLLEWTERDVWEYIRAHKLPYNPLHDRQFPSIGCVPCTRAVEPGQDSRAGRWWWETPESRECGLQPRIQVLAKAS